MMSNPNKRTDARRREPANCHERYRLISKRGQPLVSASALRGLPVFNYDHERLGVLKDLMIESNRGTVAYAVLLFEKEKSFALPFNALEIDPEAMQLYADIQREVFEQGEGLVIRMDREEPHD